MDECRHRGRKKDWQSFIRPSTRRGLGKFRTRQRRLEERSLPHLPLGTLRVAKRRRPRHRLHQRPRLDVRGVLREILGAPGFLFILLFRHHVTIRLLTAGNCLRCCRSAATFQPSNGPAPTRRCRGVGSFGWVPRNTPVVTPLCFS